MNKTISNIEQSRSEASQPGMGQVPPKSHYKYTATVRAYRAAQLKKNPRWDADRKSKWRAKQKRTK